jgi:uncharacterized protein YjbJ (UPF0337 family)
MVVAPSFKERVASRLTFRIIQRRRLSAMKEVMMNEDILKGQWNQLKGQLRKQWGRLTDDDIDQIKGQRDILLGKLQEYYGKDREQNERELERWLEGYREGARTRA